MSHADHLSGPEPTDAERQLLDDALEEFIRDRDPGKPWREVLGDLFASAHKTKNASPPEP